MYIPKYFNINELTPPEVGSVIQMTGDEWAFSTLFDERLLITADFIRDKFGPMVANDWASGGSFRYRGFRPVGCDVGAAYSQHRFGRGLDLSPLNISVYKIREDILNYPDSPQYQFIGGLEMNIPWLHIDVRARKDGNILLFNP